MTFEKFAECLLCFDDFGLIRNKFVTFDFMLIRQSLRRNSCTNDDKKRPFDSKKVHDMKKKTLNQFVYISSDISIYFAFILND